MTHPTTLHFGIKTATTHATHEALLHVWQAADALSIFEHAWLNDHLMSLYHQSGDQA